MAGPPELMALEREIMLVLESADAIVHTGGSVVLTFEGEEGLALMRGE
jgi:heat shock protein HslJ